MGTGVNPVTSMEVLWASSLFYSSRSRKIISSCYSGGLSENLVGA